MPNELATSTSPYLRAHADNPVDSRMSTKDALAEAARRDVPLLISIGYSTCHPCHAMAHESLADDAPPALLHDPLAPVKIDREELPDIDSYYMNALQAMTGQGGWPMTIFATPAGSPFYAGTYFPPSPRGNLPSFTQVLTAVSQTWTDRRDEVDQMTQRPARRGGRRVPERRRARCRRRCAARFLRPRLGRVRSGTEVAADDEHPVALGRIRAPGRNRRGRWRRLRRRRGSGPGGLGECG